MSHLQTSRADAPLPTGGPECLALQGGIQHKPPSATHMCRAERFGTQYVEPGKRQDLQLEFRKEKFKKDGFKTGLTSMMR